ncbi:MAG: hypothetical protein ACOWWM_05330 [Desulfobacterales bacterium]
MKSICAIAAIVLLIAFSAVNLFIPYALAVLALLFALGYSCKVIQKSRNRECRLGFC